MKHIYKKWLLRTTNYSGYIVILSPIAYKITKLSFLQPIIEISCFAVFIGSIILFCNDCYVTRGIRAAIKKNRYSVIFWLVWTLFIILLFLCK